MRMGRVFTALACLTLAVSAAACDGGSAGPSTGPVSGPDPEVGDDPGGVIESVAWIPWEEAGGEEVQLPLRVTGFVHLFTSSSENSLRFGVFNTTCPPLITVSVDEHSRDRTTLRLDIADYVPTDTECGTLMMGWAFEVVTVESVNLEGLTTNIVDTRNRA